MAAKQDPKDSMMQVLLDELVGKDMPPDVSMDVIDTINFKENSRARPKVVERERELSWRDYLPLATAAVLVVAIAIAVPVFRSLGLPYANDSRSALAVGDLPFLASSNETINPEALIVLREGESRELEYADGSRITISDNAQAGLLTHRERTSQKAWNLTKGKMVVELVSQDTLRPFFLESEQVHVSSTLADFEITVQDNETQVIMHGGSLLVTPLIGGVSHTIETGDYALVSEGGNFDSGRVPSDFVFSLVDSDRHRVLNRFLGTKLDAEIDLSSALTKNLNVRFEFQGPQNVRYARFRVSYKNAQGETKRFQSFDSEAPFHVFGDRVVGGITLAEDWTPENGTYTIEASVLLDNDLSFQRLAELELSVLSESS